MNGRYTSETDWQKCKVIHIIYKSSTVAEMGDRGHNRHGPTVHQRHRQTDGTGQTTV